MKRADEFACGLEMLVEGFCCRQCFVCEKLGNKIELCDVRSQSTVLRQLVNLRVVDRLLPV